MSQLLSESVTITHPHHPWRGQRVTIVRIRQGADPDLIVQLPDGTRAALALRSTDYAGVSAPPETPWHLLALDGLRQMAHLLAQLRQQGRVPAPPATYQANRHARPSSYDTDI